MKFNSEQSEPICELLEFDCPESPSVRYNRIDYRKEFKQESRLEELGREAAVQVLLNSRDISNDAMAEDAIDRSYNIDFQIRKHSLQPRHSRQGRSSNNLAFKDVNLANLSYFSSNEQQSSVSESIGREEISMEQKYEASSVTDSEQSERELEFIELPELKRKGTVLEQIEKASQFV